MKIHIQSPERAAEGVPARVMRNVPIEDAEGAALALDMAKQLNARLVVVADTPLDEVIALFRP